MPAILSPEDSMLDKSKAMNDFQITEQEYDELLSDFAAQAAEKIDTFESAVKRGDMKEASGIAHSLKGVAGNLRLDDCYNSARSIEAALKGNDCATIDSELSNLKKAVDEIRTVIKKIK
jgi:HPt (histidine-containing phosphotransfer) domain-containing protein